MTLGEKIKALRLKNNIKQSELAESLGVARTAISNWEKDINKPNVDLISNMCYLFHVNPDYFFDIKNSSESEETDSEEFSKEEIEQQAIRLYNALLNAGFVREGQELSEAQMKAIEGVCDILAFVFEAGN